MCKAWDDHKERGRREGLQQGKLEILISLVKENLLPLAEAAKRANMSEKEFSKLCS